MAKKPTLAELKKIAKADKKSSNQELVTKLMAHGCPAEEWAWDLALGREQKEKLLQVRIREDLNEAFQAKLEKEGMTLKEWMTWQINEYTAN